MAGINLSQSIKEKQELARGNFFDRSFFINVGIFLLVAGLYGGSTWYLGTFETELGALQTESMQKKADLKGPEIDQVVDFETRVKAIAASQASNPDPNAVFLELEQRTLPTIRLTGYERNEAEHVLTIRGTTTSLKYVAQQMLAYKKAIGIESVHVEMVQYNDAGAIEFELQLPMIALVAETSQ